MSLLAQLKRKWQTLITGYRFMQLVEARYGDFGAIGRLSNVINNPDKLKEIIKFIASDEQGRKL
jgi:ubiquinone biosynthesis protein Coq4